MKRKRRRVEVDLERLDGILDSSGERPLDEQEREALRAAIHEMAARLAPGRSSEKTAQVMQEFGLGVPSKKERNPPARGHGRNGADAFTGADRVPVPHPELKPACLCPGCSKGKVYAQRDKPSPIIRFVAGPPIGATIYELESLRCNLCGEIYKAEPPEGVGPDKYDETASSMVGVAKYGYGIPFNRLEGLQKNLGVPLPASTQWELVEDAAEVLKPAHDELIRQAAQAQVLHSDGTRVNIIEEIRPPEHDKRTGQFTTGLVADLGENRRAALFMLYGDRLLYALGDTNFPAPDPG